MSDGMDPEAVWRLALAADEGIATPIERTGHAIERCVHLRAPWAHCDS